MIQSFPDIPAPVAGVLKRLPVYPGSILFVVGLNAMLLDHMPSDTLSMLEDKKLCISVIDAKVGFYFTCINGRFKPIAKVLQTDLTISANLRDFIIMMQRQEDPDTLFFNRRLIMEGDTELGLLVKNTLDSIDLKQIKPFYKPY